MKKLLLLLALLVSIPANATVCYVTVHKNLFQLSNGIITGMPDSPVDQWSIDFTTDEDGPRVFPSSAEYIGVTCTAIAYFAMGTNPTATVASRIVPAGITAYFPVTPGQEISFYDGN